MISVVAGMIVNDKNEVLVLKHNKCKGLWMFPVGKVELLETKYQAIKREMFEEIGIELKSKDLKIFEYCSPEWYDRIDGIHSFNETTFLISDYIGIPENKEPHKHEELKWINIDEIIKNPILYSRSCWRNCLLYKEKFLSEVI